MPLRSQAIIRRDINRLNDLVDQKGAEFPALNSVAGDVHTAANDVNTAWNTFQSASILGDKERSERDESIEKLINSIRQWRPVVLIKVPGASENIHNLPPSGSTPDDVIRVAEDMLTFINTNPQAKSFREAAAADLSTAIESAKKETSEATAALPQETAARTAFSNACLEANNILVTSIDIVRAIFGRTSPEYRQFIARNSKTEEDQIEEEALVGEG
jgi:hypothetical protein